VSLILKSQQIPEVTIITNSQLLRFAVSPGRDIKFGASTNWRKVRKPHPSDTIRE
jgi:hypothetical protein